MNTTIRATARIPRPRWSGEFVPDRIAEMGTSRKMNMITMNNGR
jgi:hypothetical protein